jgi:hypothetical protein
MTMYSVWDWRWLDVVWTMFMNPLTVPINRSPRDPPGSERYIYYWIHELLNLCISNIPTFALFIHVFGSGGLQTWLPTFYDHHVLGPRTTSKIPPRRLSKCLSWPGDDILPQTNHPPKISQVASRAWSTQPSEVFQKWSCSMRPTTLCPPQRQHQAKTPEALAQPKPMEAPHTNHPCEHVRPWFWETKRSLYTCA